MILITKSETADTRTCDVTKVSKGQLKRASHSHIADVRQALAQFQAELARAAREHDHTKLEGTRKRPNSERGKEKPRSVVAPGFSFWRGSGGLGVSLFEVVLGRAGHEVRHRPALLLRCGDYGRLLLLRDPHPHPFHDGDV